MAENTTHSSEWTGLRGRVMGWYLGSFLRRLSEVLVLGDSRSNVLAETWAALGGKGIVLDVGAGAGYFSLAIARQLQEGKVICVDLSREMLSHLRGTAERRCLSDRVEILEGSAYQIRLDDQSVDLAIANGVFHELVRPELAMQEMVRVVRPGGRVIVTDFRADTWIGSRIAAAHRSEDHGPFRLEELKTLFLQAGLDDVRVSAVRNFVMGVGVKYMQ